MRSVAAAGTTRESDADPAALFALPATHGAAQEDCPSQTFGRSVGQVLFYPYILKLGLRSCLPLSPKASAQRQLHNMFFG